MQCFKMGFPSGSDGKESVFNAGDTGSIPGSGRSPREEKWPPTLVFLPGKPHGQRTLAGYSPWGHKRVGHDLATKQHSTPINIQNTMRG